VQTGQKEKEREKKNRAKNSKYRVESALGDGVVSKRKSTEKENQEKVKA